METMNKALLRHPALVPDIKVSSGLEGWMYPPKFTLEGILIGNKRGVLLIWKAPGPIIPTIASFQIFYYKETDEPPHPFIWEELVEIREVSLRAHLYLQQTRTSAHTQRFHFIIRAKRDNGICGEFSDPFSIVI